MRPKGLYLALSVVGTILPVAHFLPFLRLHGLDPRLFMAQLFASPVSGFFGLDVIVSTVVLWIFVASEGRRLVIRGRWAPVAATLLIGVSLGLPLFLYLRERRLEQAAAGTA
jgi:hypothetical protein